MNRQPELFLLFKLGLREEEKLSSRERTNIKSGEDLSCARERQAKQTKTHTYTHTTVECIAFR